eukprot:2724922-Prymnesium_polylepis.1
MRPICLLSVAHAGGLQSRTRAADPRAAALHGEDFHRARGEWLRPAGERRRGPVLAALLHRLVLRSPQEGGGGGARESGKAQAGEARGAARGGRRQGDGPWQQAHHGGASRAAGASQRPGVARRWRGGRGARACRAGCGTGARREEGRGGAFAGSHRRRGAQVGGAHRGE